MLKVKEDLAAVITMRQLMNQVERKNTLAQIENRQTELWEDG